jgi:hypothetical protein
VGGKLSSDQSVSLPQKWLWQIKIIIGSYNPLVPPISGGWQLEYQLHTLQMVLMSQIARPSLARIQDLVLLDQFARSGRSHSTGVESMSPSHYPAMTDRRISSIRASSGQQVENLLSCICSGTAVMATYGGSWLEQGFWRSPAATLKNSSPPRLGDRNG